jgi:hypothetical protein
VSTRSRRLALVALAAVLVAIVALASTRSSTGSSAGGTDSGATSPTSTAIATGSEPNQSGTTTDPTTLGPTDPNVVPPTTQPVVVPLNVSVSSTSDLTDAQPVDIHITPDAGANVYGAEAFLCAPDTTFRLDADIRPSISGKCVTKRLSPKSLDYLNKAVGPPYQSLDLSFPVGVGSDTFTTQDGRTITIICGPGHPCVLALKLQFSHGFGFRAYPLTYR